MLTMQPTLLIGPADWDAARMPREEFARRIDALWQHAGEASRAIVFGNRQHHAELAYFTNFVPKLEPAVAVLARDGAQRLFVGSPNMLGAARPLTFIENVSPMKDMAPAIASEPQRSLLIGAEYMPAAFRETVTQAIGEHAGAVDATAPVWAQMRRKSRHELDAINAAVKLTGAARMAMREAMTMGAGVTDVILAGEAAAIEAGAQDVRTLFSLDGGRTLRPFVTSVAQKIDPVLTYLAVRRSNYWAECFALVATRLEPSRLHERALEALRSAMSAVKAGVATHAIERQIATALGAYRPHPVMAPTFAQRMGLALDEPPYTNIGETFEEGEVYSLHIGALDDARAGVVCSRMFTVGVDGVVAFDDEARTPD
jgi:Xaa-Pro aminopeptidase